MTKFPDFYDFLLFFSSLKVFDHAAAGLVILLELNYALFAFFLFLNLQIFSLTMPLQGCVMTLEFWNLCNFLYSFKNYLILIVSIVYSYIMLLHILISENFKLWAFWSLNTEAPNVFWPLASSHVLVGSGIHTVVKIRLFLLNHAIPPRLVVAKL